MKLWTSFRGKREVYFEGTARNEKSWKIHKQHKGESPSKKQTYKKWSSDMQFQSIWFRRLCICARLTGDRSCFLSPELLFHPGGLGSPVKAGVSRFNPFMWLQTRDPRKSNDCNKDPSISMSVSRSEAGYAVTRVSWPGHLASPEWSVEAIGSKVGKAGGWSERGRDGRSRHGI